MAVSQAGMFPELGAGGRASPDGWIRAGSSCARGTLTWRHPAAPGITVRHCGHPTALRPYYLTGVDIARKFSGLAAAKAAALNPDPWIKETAEWRRLSNDRTGT